MPSSPAALKSMPPISPPTTPTTIVPRHPRFQPPPVTARASAPATKPTTIQPSQPHARLLGEALGERVELVVQRGRQTVAEHGVVLLDQRELGAPLVLVDREQLVERTRPRAPGRRSATRRASGSRPIAVSRAAAALAHRSNTHASTRLFSP